MFQVDWAQAGLWQRELPLVPESTDVAVNRVKRETIRRTELFHWEEHCQECAIPTCYSTCSLFMARADKRCARFVYGIYPNPQFQGLFDFGADIRFRRWAKLETQLYGKSVSLERHRLLDRLNRTVTRPLNHQLRGVATLESTSTSDHSSRARVTVQGKTLFAKARNKYLTGIAPRGETAAYDEFVLECFSPEVEAFRLILEYFEQDVKTRNSFVIKPGWNLHPLAAEAFGFGSKGLLGKILLYPENNQERRVVFTWLDLVEYQQEYRSARTLQPAKAGRPAAKVKCVAWDLDNTLWRGILAEDTEAGLSARAEAVDLVAKLDDRGIIQTVVSKNNFADAWPVVERMGLKEYFLYPAINWEPKSSSLRSVAARLNINLDTFALIDDSPFERAEVQATVPQVRVYSDDEITRLLTYSEFDVPVTEATKLRRQSYVTEVRREEERANFGDDYEMFLRSCRMSLRLFVPREEKHILRCLELIQRANQLNLSNTRYSEQEFRSLLATPGLLCIGMECEDRFGNYGIVGFASVDEQPEVPVVRDFVLSCRVAQKRVEHAFIQWYAQRMLMRNCKLLSAAIVRTDRNGPITQVFDDLGFREAAKGGGFSIVSASCATVLAEGTPPVIVTADQAVATSTQNLAV